MPARIKILESAVSTAREKPEPKRLDFTQENALRAGRHWVEFIQEVEGNMAERGDAITQLELAVLARKHSLMLGHGGTAKSTLNRMVLGRIVDEEGNPSLFDHQLHVESRRTDVIGPKLPSTNPVTGEMSLRLKIEEGLAPYTFAFLDEIFDAPPAVLRGALLTAMVDRVLAEGGATHVLRLQTVGAASNKTLAELKAKFKDELDALLDRFAFLFWTVKRPLDSEAGVQITRAYGKRKLRARTGKPMGMRVPPMTFAELDVLHQAVDYVEERMINDDWAVKLIATFYRTYHAEMDHAEGQLGQSEQGGGRSKMESPRTQNVMMDILPAIAVRRWCRDPDSPLAVIPEDFNELRLFLMMRGPDVNTIPANIDVIGDKQDRKILERLRTENEVFDHVYERVVDPRVADSRSARGTNVEMHQRTVRTAIGQEEILGHQGSREQEECIQSNIRNLITALRELSTHAAHVGGVEGSYAQGVHICIRFLTHAIGKGQIRMAIKIFREHIQPHTTALQSSFYRAGVGEAQTAFKEAIKITYESIARRAARDEEKSLYDVMQLMEEVTRLEDILGADVIPLLADTVRRSALDKALGQPVQTINPEQVLEACAKYGQWDRLRTLLGEGGIKGKVPLGELAEMHTKTLHQLLDILSATNDAMVGEVWEVTESRHVLREVGDVLCLYKGMNGSLLQARDAENLPEDAIQSYMAMKAREKQATHRGATMTWKVEPIPDDPSIRVRWKTAYKKKEKTNPEDTRRKYRAYCLDQLWNNENGLLDDPRIKSQWERILLMARTVFESDWRKEFEEAFKKSYIQAIQTAYTTEENAEFMFPIEPSRLAVRAKFLIAVNTAKDAVDRAVQDAQENPTQREGFLASLGYEPTENNVKELGRHLTSERGEEDFSLESTSVETEDILTDDIVIHATQDRQAEWTALHDSIATAIQKLGQNVSNFLIQERLGELDRTGRPENARAFITMYDALRSSVSESMSAELVGKSIEVDLTQNEHLIRRMREDFEMILGAIVPDPRNDLSVAVEELSELKAFLGNATSIGTASLMDPLNTAAKEKVAAWLDGRIANHQAADKEVPMQGKSANSRVKIDLVHAALQQLDPAKEAQNIQRQLDEMDVDFLPDETERNAQVKVLQGAVGGRVKGLADQAINTLEQFEGTVTVGGTMHTFRLDDLEGTITRENHLEVLRFMDEARVITKTEEIITTAETTIRGFNQAMSTETPMDFGPLKQRVAAVETEFRRHMGTLISI